MRIVCPTCEATYNVPDAALSPGRPVRCARCGNNWVPQRELLLGELWLEPGTGVPRPGPAQGQGLGYPQTLPGSPAPGSSAPAPRHADGTGPRDDQIPDLRAEKFALRPRPAALLDIDDEDDTFEDEPPAPISRATVIAAWAASIFVLAVAASIVVLARDDIMKAWPASERLFHMVKFLR